MRMMPRLSPVHIVRLTQVGSLKIRFRPFQIHEVRRRRVNSALRNAGKCDNLSFLRVCLARMDSVRGGSDGLALLLEDRRMDPLRVLLFDPQSASTAKQAFSTVHLVFCGLAIGANHTPPSRKATLPLLSRK